MAPAGSESARVRNSALHATLEEFTLEVARRLTAETAGGAEVPFELIEERAGGTPLYCYRALSREFIADRLGLLRGLETYAPAVRALADVESVVGYLQLHGEARIPTGARERAESALRLFLGAVFAERSQFAFDRDRFESAYLELERSLYEGRCLNTVIAPLLGVTLDVGAPELALGEGLSLVRGETLADAPAEAVWGDGDEPNVLVVLSAVQERGEQPPLSLARVRFRKVLTALRLFESGGYALGPLAWARADAGAWRTVALSSSGRPGLVTLIAAAQYDELRGFFNLVCKRAPASSSCGELAWALARFELGCERLAPFEALTDYLLALRALLEPEGPSSGRLAQRLSAICARPEDRASLAERTAHAISLERAVISGVIPAEPRANELVDELSENLRALLRDMICGHLDADVCPVADELSSAAVGVP
jgi:hypothetical protein